MKITSLIILIILFGTINLNGQTSNYKLEFKNGTSIIGQIIKQTDDSLTLKTNEGNLFQYIMTDIKVISPAGFVESSSNKQTQQIIEVKQAKVRLPISVGLNFNYNNTSLTQTGYSPLVLSNRNTSLRKFKNNSIGLQFNFIKGISNKLDFNVGLSYTKYSINLEPYNWYYWDTTNTDLFLKYISIPINLSLYNKQKSSGFYFDFGINPQLFFQIINSETKESITKEIGMNRDQYRVISFNSLLGLGYYFKINNDIKVKAGLNYTAELLEFNISYFKNSLSTVSNKHNFYPTVGINYTINKK
jgi:hypothetical protein